MITSFLFQSAAPLPLDELRAHLDAIPTARQDKWEATVFIVADDVATLKHIVDARDASQAGYPRTVALVTLYETRVEFSLQTREVETVRAFARWILGAYKVAILDEAFNDITAACDDNLDHLFGKPSKRRLTRIGFFRELKHGRADGPSLREAVSEKGKPGESRIATYLRSAPIMMTALGPVKDVLEPKSGFICAPNIRTDGVYVWPEDLAYYVERHHAVLPAEFLAHIAAAKWQPPTELDTSLLETV